MLKLVDRILEKIPYDSFTDAELIPLLTGSPAARYNRVRRALRGDELFVIRRGLYGLAKRYQRNGIHPFELAQKIHGPSYVSFESALSYHHLIPEGVQGVVSVSIKRSREFRTSLGVYSYLQIPVSAFLVGVKRIQEEGHVFLMATPLKALADYVYVNHLNWKGVEPLIENLRIEREELKFESNELEEIASEYKQFTRGEFVVQFLAGIKKDLDL